jgi:hypothetical protein
MFKALFSRFKISTFEPLSLRFKFLAISLKTEAYFETKMYIYDEHSEILGVAAVQHCSCVDTNIHAVQMLTSCLINKQECFNRFKAASAQREWL